MPVLTACPVMAAVQGLAYNISRGRTPPAVLGRDANASHVFYISQAAVEGAFDLAPLQTDEGLLRTSVVLAELCHFAVRGATVRTRKYHDITLCLVMPQLP